jgi:hypothetical protein
MNLSNNEEHLKAGLLFFEKSIADTIRRHLFSNNNTEKFVSILEKDWKLINDHFKNLNITLGGIHYKREDKNIIYAGPINNKNKQNYLKFIEKYWDNHIALKDTGKLYDFKITEILDNFSLKDESTWGNYKASGYYQNCNDKNIIASIAFSLITYREENVIKKRHFYIYSHPRFGGLVLVQERDELNNDSISNEFKEILKGMSNRIIEVVHSVYNFCIEYNNIYDRYKVDDSDFNSNIREETESLINKLIRIENKKNIVEVDDIEPNIFVVERVGNNNSPNDADYILIIRLYIYIIRKDIIFYIVILLCF